MRADLKAIDWFNILQDKSVEEQWSFIRTQILDSVSAHVPQKIPSTKHRKPQWMNERVLSRIKRKRSAFELYKQTREGKDYLAYTKARNAAKAETRRAVRDFEREIAKRARTNPKAFYSFVHSKLRTRSTISDLRLENGVEVTSESEKADTFNQFFSSVYTQETKDRMSAQLILVKNQLLDIEIVQEEVLQLLKKTKIDKSPGLDGIHPRVLKECAAELAEPLTVLFRKTLQGEIPADWREASVTPIYKKGKRTDVTNYRPISLTSIICKIMEKLIRNALLHHLISEKILSDYQHGFTLGRSCTTQLLQIFDKWTEILDEGGSIDVIYLDLAKAFDTVPHQRLLAKLSGYGVGGKILEWIKQFLIGRKQKVRVGQAESTWSEVLSGVPQGSVLGPVLFICYINDLPDIVNSFIYMYADDTKLFRRVDNNEDREELQRDLDLLGEWASKWQLRFNVEKCKTMHLGTTHDTRFKYEMKRSNGQPPQTLEETTEEKDLGVLISSTLKPSAHIVAAVNKANQILGLIRRSFTYMDIPLMKQLYTSLVRPHLEFGNIILHPHLKGDMGLLERVQHRATRMIPGLAKLDYEARLAKMDLPSLAFRRARGDAIETYKFLHGIYKVDPSSMLPLYTTDGVTTRGHSLKLQKRDCRTQLRKNFFGLRTVNSWNQLPETIVQASSVNAFKGLYDRHFADQRYTERYQP
jgi:hypothetical protein